MNWTQHVIISLGVSIGQAAFGQTPILVRDYNPTPLTKVSADPDSIVMRNGTLYFAADSADYGVELFQSVAASSRPSLVVDIAAGRLSSNPRNLTVTSRGVFFSAFTRELWITDGSRSGTAFLARAPAPIEHVFSLGNRAVFVVRKPHDHGRVGSHVDHRSLWVSDGTSGGTKQIGPDDNHIQNPVVVGGQLFYTGYSLMTGYELWRSDGTVAGTRLVREVQPGSLPSHSRFGTWIVGEVGGKLLFAAKDPVHEWAHWISDGTAAGTVLIKDIDGPVRRSFGLLEFYTSNSGALGNHALFIVDEGASVFGLWSTDGTSIGTRRIQPVTGFGTVLEASPNHVFMAVATGPRTLAMSLWASDGTAAGTQLCLGSLHGAWETVTVGNELLFNNGSPLTSSGTELWRSDGTPVGTKLLKDINPGRFASTPRNMVPSPFGAIFSANDGTNGWQLWRSDGTTPGTALVGIPSNSGRATADSHPGVFDSDLGQLIMNTSPGNGTGSIWVTDGTGIGSQRLMGSAGGHSAESLGAVSILGVSASRGSELVALEQVLGRYVLRNLITNQAAQPTKMRGHVYFSATIGPPLTPSVPRGLWRTDGTVAGTKLFWSPPVGAYRTHNLVAIDNRLFFAAGGAFGADDQIYFTDGTSVTMLDSRGWAQPYGMPEFMLAHGDKLFFVTNTALWQTDGTRLGTQKIVAANGSVPVPYASHPAGFTTVGGLLFFIGESSTAPGQPELWRTDGTRQGTIRIVGPAEDTFHLSNMVEHAGRLFFLAADPAHGLELWVSDGTLPGTRMVKDIGLGSEGLYLRWMSYPSGMMSTGRWLYFAADDGVHGMELWRTDGTTARTTLVHDMAPGVGGATPATFAICRGELLFSATASPHGRELWSLEVGAHTQRFGSGCGASKIPRLDATLPQLGTKLSIELTRAAPGSTGLLFLGLELQDITYLGHGCSIYIDLGLPYVSTPVVADPQGVASVQTLLPSSPALHGLNLTMQGGMTSPGSPPLGVDLSNGLLLAVRR